MNRLVHRLVLFLVAGLLAFAANEAWAAWRYDTVAEVDRSPADSQAATLQNFGPQAMTQKSSNWWTDFTTWASGLLLFIK